VEGSGVGLSQDELGCSIGFHSAKDGSGGNVERWAKESPGDYGKGPSHCHWPYSGWRFGFVEGDYLLSGFGLFTSGFWGGCLQVVQSLNHEQPWGRYAQFLDDVRAVLQGSPFYAVQFVLRDANKVAHALAKLAISQSVDYMWLDECPSSIHHLVYADHGFSTWLMKSLIKKKKKIHEYISYQTNTIIINPYFKDQVKKHRYNRGA
jgi:hypothetical protein